MPSTLLRSVLVAAAATLALAACGDDDGGSGSGDEIPPGALEIGAETALRFDPDELEAPAGEVTFALVNDGSLPHTFVIEGLEDDLKLTVSGDGDVDTGSIELAAGDYVFYCDVAGHRGGGMEGTLTVE
jgi:plastocyanin